ncbi:endonuclease I family protein [Metabacillus halosaccharovorans]|uniref:endonuclease I family protein n=1 Tax=Metabacillus halosaccharovorans TaxID=930124 RepID=UPI00203CB0EB|nr:endonuclease [Metabacillus halosaccharovorans]MCM3441578.1 endonuclease [Metabacillus halosaccharovorans]
MDQVNHKLLYTEVDLDELLVEVKHNKIRINKEQEYYDKEEDQQIIKQYYRDISFHTTDKKELFMQLSELITKTHEIHLPYNSTTRNYLYSWVDLQMDGTIKSIYSGKNKHPEQLIKEDYEAELSREKAISKLKKMTAGNEVAILDTIKVIEKENMYNCEHVVPQSWFDKDNPMRGDLHHLFTCEKICNSLRSNYPYYDFTDYSPEFSLKGIASECGKYEDQKFEPESGKGEVARATLYFILRYPNEIHHYDRRDIQLLLKWHHECTVTTHEKHRNKAIFEKQKNRNPLIDFPQIADKIDFSVGLK